MDISIFKVFRHANIGPKINRIVISTIEWIYAGRILLRLSFSPFVVIPRGTPEDEEHSNAKKGDSSREF